MAVLVSLCGRFSLWPFSFVAVLDVHRTQPRPRQVRIIINTEKSWKIEYVVYDNRGMQAADIGLMDSLVAIVRNLPRGVINGFSQNIETALTISFLTIIFVEPLIQKLEMPGV